MVTWGRAWKAAATWLAYSLYWGLVGIAFILMGFVIILYAPTSSAIRLSPLPYSVNLVGLIFMAVGWFILALGAVASFFKVNSEIIAEEVQSYE